VLSSNKQQTITRKINSISLVSSQVVGLPSLSEETYLKTQFSRAAPPDVCYGIERGGQRRQTEVPSSGGRPNSA
jgi:hypothetical protein